MPTFQMQDKDKNGALSQDEWALSLTIRMQFYDKNQDGVLTASDLKLASGAAAGAMVAQDCRDILRKAMQRRGMGRGGI